jgi:YihY family inner membrane protein
MATSAPGEWRDASRAREGNQSGVQARLGALATDAKGAMTFWQKVNNDWVFNLSAMLAYNFLMSVFPILLVLLAVAGFVIGNLAPTQQASFENALNNALPGGETIVTAVTHQLQRSAGILFVVGLVTAGFAGSRLFVALENCFGVIFRLRSRDFIRQNLMALGMFLLYLVLIPLVVLGSIIPSAILSTIKQAALNPLVDFLTQLVGILVSVVIACILLCAIYVVVPNRPVHLREVWKGTLVAAALLVIYNLVFPFYESYFLHPNNYGSLAGFAIVILVFLYYLGFLILIGAEVNSWASGQRQTAADLPSMLHEVQSHDTTQNATTVVEHTRQDHDRDTEPPKPAEAQMPSQPPAH